MEILNEFFKEKSKTFALNKSHSKTINICVGAVNFELKFNMRLNHVSNRNYVEFSTESWKTLIDRAEEIKGNLENFVEQDIFINNDLKVFTESMHDQCAICFLDQRGIRVNIMLKTFKNMINLQYALSHEYATLNKKVKNTAKNLKLLADSIFTRYTECGIRNRQFKEFLNKLQQSIDPLCNVSQTSLPINHSIDFDDSDEDTRFLDRFM